MSYIAKWKMPNGTTYDIKSAVCSGNSATATNADQLDGYHEYSFLRWRGTTRVDQEGSLWSQIGLKEYGNALPDGLSDIYQWGVCASLATENGRFDIYCPHFASATAGLWYRSGWGSDKQQWRRIIDSYSISSQSVAYATNADTLDGYHASSFLPISGGTMTGSICSNTSYPLYFNAISSTASYLATSSGNIYFANNTSGGKIHLETLNTDIYHRKSGSDYIMLDTGNYTSYTVTKTGSGASGTWPINITGQAGSLPTTTFTKTITITTSWQQTGIASPNLSTGAYLIYMTGIWDTDKSWQDSNRYVGIMSWYSGGTNSVERFDIPLHSTGHARNGYQIYLSTLSHEGNPTNSTTLEIKSNVNFSRATSIYFQFVKLV